MPQRDAELVLQNRGNALVTSACALHAKRREVDHRARKTLGIAVRGEAVVDLDVGDGAQLRFHILQSIVYAAPADVCRGADENAAPCERKIRHARSELAGVEQ